MRYLFLLLLHILMPLDLTAALVIQRSPAFSRQDPCAAYNEVTCDSGCMPLGYVCCNYGNGLYCLTASACDVTQCVDLPSATPTPTPSSVPGSSSGSKLFY